MTQQSMAASLPLNNEAVVGDVSSPRVIPWACLWVVALALAAALAFAAPSQAKSRPRAVKCRAGYVRRLVRMPARRHGMVHRQHGKVVYTRVPRCVKVSKPKRKPGPFRSRGSSTNGQNCAFGARTGITGATSAGYTLPDSGPSPIDPPGSTQSVCGTTYALEGMDTFTEAAPLGSFASSAWGEVVYTGDHGMGWTEYPDGWPSTHSGSAEGYQPSTVQSVHDGVLDFYLHDDANGNPVGADPSPLPGGNRYQTYGVWSFCEKVAAADSYDLSDFHQAPLLWPQNESGWQSAESDYPEADLNALDFSGYTHYGGSGSQDVFNIQSIQPSFDPTQWHVYTQTWGPGRRSYYVDGKLVGTSTNQLWSGPERWQLQIEPSVAAGGGSGHVYVKWVWIGTPTR